MTISTESTRVEFTGDGATLPFAVPFKFLDKTDLVVVLRTILTGVEAVQTIYTHYTVTGAGDANGTVTFVTAPPSTQRVVIYNDPPLTQLVDYLAGDTFPAETHETALDRLTIQQKRTREITTRAILLPDADTDGSGAYDAKSNRIKNLGTPTATTDATTKTYVDALVNNTALGPAPTGLIATGSITSRLLADRWGEVKNVKDFGATGDGVTDDTAAIQAAITAAVGNVVTYPSGTYRVATSFTLSGRIHLLDGAVLAPDLSRTITLNALIVGGVTDGTWVGGAGTVSIVDKVVTVPGDFTTVQEAVDACPKELFQRYTINVSAGTYAEDVRISGISSRLQAPSGERARLVLQGVNLTNGDATIRIKSITAHDCTGSNNHPTLAYLTVYGDNGYSPGPPAATAIYGCTSAQLYGLSYDGDGVLYCINAYASRVMVTNTDFADSVNQYAMLTKHLGTINAQSGCSGTLTTNVVRPESGPVNVYNSGDMVGLAGFSRTFRDESSINSYVVDAFGQQAYNSTNVGAPWGYNYETMFDGIDGLESATTGSGSIIQSVGGLYLRSGTTASSTIRLSLSRSQTLSSTINWESVPRWFGYSYIRDEDNTTAYGVIGDTTGKYIGFKEAAGSLYAVAHNGTTESQSLITASPASGVQLFVRTFVSPDQGTYYAQFYQGSTLVHTMTTGLPTGSGGAMLWDITTENSDTTSCDMRLGHLKCGRAF